MAYEVLTKRIDIERAMDALSNLTLFAFDLETTGLDQFEEDFEIVGAGFTWEAGQGVYIAFNALEDIEVPEVIELIRTPLEDPEKGIIGHNIKYDALCCYRFGINITNIVFDTFVAHYALMSDKMRHNLDDVSMHHLNILKTRTKNLIPRKSKNNPKPSMKDADYMVIGIYCCEDTDTTWQLFNHFRHILEKPENNYAKYLFYDIDMPMCRVLYKMEAAGVALDQEYLESFHNRIVRKINRYYKYIVAKAGEEFSITAPLEVGRIFFEVLKCHERAGVKLEYTSKKNYKTDKGMFEKMASVPEVRAFLKIKQLQKLRTTYTTGLLKKISPFDGMVHGSYNQCVTTTARLSSSGPNLQNIPSRSEIGRTIRKCFVSRWRDIGGKMLAADYSQAEVRLLAHVSNDETLIDEYCKTDIKPDVYSRTARSMRGMAPDAEVPSSMRSDQKAIVLGINYGEGAKKLGMTLGISKEEAEVLIKNYLDAMPGVRDAIRQTHEFLRDNGYVESMFGRRRFIPKIYSDDILDQWAAQREAFNHKLQSANADLIKIAMIKIDEQLEMRNLKSKLIMQVHDEVVLDVHPDEFSIVRPMVVEVMENCRKFKVPMQCDAHYADNWSEAH